MALASALVILGWCGLASGAQAFVIGSLSFAPPTSIDAGAPYVTPESLGSGLTAASFTGISCPSTSLCVGLTAAGDVITSTDPTAATPTWSAPQSIDTENLALNDGTFQATAISCASDDLCAVTDDDGDVLVSTDPAASTPTWTRHYLGGDPTSVSCQADGSELCVAVNTEGGIFVSTAPGAGSWQTQTIDEGGNSTDPDPADQPGTDFVGVACATVEICTVEGASTGSPDPATVYMTTDASCALAGSCTPDFQFGNSLSGTAVSCAQDTTCLTVSGTGVSASAEASDSPGGAGSATSAGDHDLTAVSCDAAGDLCALVDDDGDVSVASDPYAANFGTAVPIEAGTALTGVSCASRGLCVAVDGDGHVLISTDPTAATPVWSTAEVAESTDPTSISCDPTGSICAAVDGRGSVVVSTDPASADPTWSPPLALGLGALTGVSCASPSSCVAVSASGQAAASTDPTAADPTWTASTSLGAGALTGVSCPGPDACEAVSSSGEAVEIDIPSGTPVASALQSADSGRDLTAVSCPSTTLCVAVDSSGYALTAPGTGQSFGTPDRIDSSAGLTTLSCPSTSLCVALDLDGYALSTTDPGSTPTPPSWSRTSTELAITVVGSAPDSTPGLACGPSDCVAYDGYGDLAVTSTPSAGNWSEASYVSGVGATAACFVEAMPASENACVVVDTDGSATVAQTQAIDVTVAGDGNGTVAGAGVTCTGSCSLPVPSDDGIPVTLTATPGPDSTFTGWSGDGCSGTGTCTISVDAVESVTATFALLPPPTAMIVSPGSDTSFALGESVPSSFSCAEATGGPGIASCADSNGSTGTSGTLPTGAAGHYSYTVTATSTDGEYGTSTITYDVAPVSLSTQSDAPGATLLTTQIDYTLVSDLNGPAPGGTVSVTAPAGVNLPTSPADFGVDYDVGGSLAGGLPVQSVSQTTSDDGAETDTLTLGGILDAHDELFIDISAVSNPASAGSGQWMVATSGDPDPIPAGAETFAPTALSGFSVTPSSTTPDATGVDYTYAFTTASALRYEDDLGDPLPTGEAGEITLTLPSGASVSGCPGAALTDTTTPADDQTLTCVSATGNQLVYALSAANVNAGDAVSIGIDGVTNPATVLNGETVSAATTSDPAGASGVLEPQLTQSITFTSSPPSAAEAGTGSYTPTATGGASGQPVSFSIAPSSSGVCAISSGVVTFTAAGTCVIDANQAGDTTYAPAPTVTQSFSVAAAPATSTTGTSTSTTSTSTSTTNTGTGTTGSGSIPSKIGDPRITGTPRAGSVLTCTSGTWNGDPSHFSYQWSLDGTPIVGATHSTYTVQSIDEGNTLTCAVVATNDVGSAGPVSTPAVGVPVPKVAGCPAASGTASGYHIGQLRLGMTRAQAKRAYTHSSERGKKYEDFFCLTPIGIRVGYGSPKLLASLRPRQRADYRDRIVWISTSSAHYTIRGVRPGATVAAARRRLKLSKVFLIGANDWYLASDGVVRAVFKARHGVIEEIGIADKALTQTRAAQLRLLTSFS